MRHFKIGDVWVINSKYKNLETVKVSRVDGDKIEAEIIDGTVHFIGDTVTFSRSKTDWSSFVYHDDTRGWFRKFIDNIFA